MVLVVLGAITEAISPKGLLRRKSDKNFRFEMTTKTQVLFQKEGMTFSGFGTVYFTHILNLNYIDPVLEGVQVGMKDISDIQKSMMPRTEHSWGPNTLEEDRVFHRASRVQEAAAEVREQYRTLFRLAEQVEGGKYSNRAQLEALKEEMMRENAKNKRKGRSANPEEGIYFEEGTKKGTDSTEWANPREESVRRARRYKNAQQHDSEHVLVRDGRAIATVLAMVASSLIPQAIEWVSGAVSKMGGKQKKYMEDINGPESDDKLVVALGERAEISEGVVREMGMEVRQLNSTVQAIRDEVYHARREMEVEMAKRKEMQGHIQENYDRVLGTEVEITALRMHLSESDRLDMLLEKAEEVVENMRRLHSQYTSIYKSVVGGNFPIELLMNAETRKAIRDTKASLQVKGKELLLDSFLELQDYRTEFLASESHLRILLAIPFYKD